MSQSSSATSRCRGVAGAPIQTCLKLAESLQIRGVHRTHHEQSSEIVNLTTLLEISQALAGTLDLKTGLHRVLETLERHHQVLRGAVTLLNDQSKELSIEASIGINTEGQRARYRLGEGITGRVAQSGRPVVVPQISREPLFCTARSNEKSCAAPSSASSACRSF